MYAGKDGREADLLKQEQLILLREDFSKRAHVEQHDAKSETFELVAMEFF